MWSLRIPAFVVAITLHEFAHARVALAFGDDTAQRQGRVSFNPLVHLDPVGSIGILLGLFGWGRPVPVDPSRLRHPRAEFFVSFAGPATNLVIAIAAAAVLHVVPVGLWQALPRFAAEWLSMMLYVLVQLNLVLCLFNFLPIYPLDGSHMAENLLPEGHSYRFRTFSHAYGFPILFSLILMSAFSGFSPLRFLIGWPVERISRFLLPG